jgi:hypothetical protein
MCKTTLSQARPVLDDCIALFEVVIYIAYNMTDARAAASIL